MRIERGLRQEVWVVLSKRNLLALLSKLEMPGSAQTIEMEGVYVSSEPDAEHYGDRVPGEMHPFTQAWMEGRGK
jgi:hypothetical protein